MGSLRPCVQKEIHIETTIDGSTLEAFRAGLQGSAYVPGEDGYDEARRAWNLNGYQCPALVVVAAGAVDVLAAVRLAREVVKQVQAYVAEAMRPFQTGATFVNFFDLTGVTPERVRAAYSPDDWERLVALKERYDPDNLFRFNRNIPPSSTGR